MQEPLILEAKGIKIGFLGYCDSPSYKQNCTEIRKLYNAGPAIYSDVIAARDVNNLRKVLNYLIIKSYGCTFSVFNLIGLLELKFILLAFLFTALRRKVAYYLSNRAKPIRGVRVGRGGGGRERRCD